MLAEPGFCQWPIPPKNQFDQLWGGYRSEEEMLTFIFFRFGLLYADSMHTNAGRRSKSAAWHIQSRRIPAGCQQQHEQQRPGAAG